MNLRTREGMGSKNHKILRTAYIDGPFPNCPEQQTLIAPRGVLYSLARPVPKVEPLSELV